jgi:hypothetical protein
LLVVVTTGVTAEVTGATVFATGVVTVAATGASVSPTGEAGGGALLAADVAGPDGVSVAAGWLGALAAGASAPAAVGSGAAEVAGGWAGLAEAAGPTVPEPVAVAPGVELEAAEATGDTAELTVDVTGDTAELTVEATGDVTELTVDVTVEAVDVCVDDKGASAAVAACAGRENTSMIAKIPAAASAACTAPRAMRCTIGCGMSSSTRRETGPLTYPWRRQQTSRNLDLLFGHHRTASLPIGQG